MPIVRLIVLFLVEVVPVVILVCVIARMISRRWLKKWQINAAIKDFEQTEDGCQLIIQTSVTSGEGGIREVEVELEGSAAYVSFDVASDEAEREANIEIDLTSGCNAVYFSDRGRSYKMMLKRSENGTWRDVSKDYIYAERDMVQ